jgi:signal transduction histidine kinase
VTRAEEAELLLAQVQRSREEQLRSARLQESTRIAREIHDVLAHALAGLTIQLEATSALIEAGAERGVVLERVRRAHALAREGLEETRHAVGVLRSDGLSVLRALEALMDDYRASAPGASVDLSVDQAAHQLDGPAALAVVRITQEALTNVRKHAPGAAVTVQLRPAHADDGALVLSICDRGGGAAPGHGGSRPHRLDRPDAASNGSSQPSGPALAEGLADSGGGYGLTGMRERAALLGGSLTAGPAADGWLVELRLPAGACEDAAGPRPAGGS